MTHPIITRTIKNINEFYKYDIHPVVIDCSVPARPRQGEDYINNVLPNYWKYLPSTTTPTQIHEFLEDERCWYDTCELAYVTFCSDDTISPHHKHATFVQLGRNGKHLCLDKFYGRAVDGAFYTNLHELAEYEGDELHTDTIEELVTLCEYLESLHEYFQPNRDAVINRLMDRATIGLLGIQFGSKFGICELTPRHNRVDVYIQVDGESESVPMFGYEGIEEVIAAVVSKYGIPENLIKVLPFAF